MMPQPVDEKCENCIFFDLRKHPGHELNDPDPDIYHYCKRFPKWAEIRRSFWCGEFRS